MLREAIQYVFGLGQATASPIVKPECEPAHVYYVRRPDGSLEKMYAAEPPAKHEAHSLVAITQFAKAADFAEIWHGPGKVVCDFGSDDLRSYITFDLVTSAQLLTLMDWVKGRALPQADLIRALRTTFRDSLGLAGSLVAILQKVRFNSTATMNGEVGHGKASLGKEVAGEVTGAGAIPEYVKFTVPVYANHSLRGIVAVVECALEPDPSNGMFRVLALPGQIEAAFELAHANIEKRLVEQLDGARVDVFYGRP